MPKPKLTYFAVKPIDDKFRDVELFVVTGKNPHEQLLALLSSELNNDPETDGPIFMPDEVFEIEKVDPCFVKPPKPAKKR